MKLDSLKKQLPAILRYQPAIVKAENPYVMSMSHRVRPQLWKWVVYYNEDFMLLVIPKGTKDVLYNEMLDIMHEFTSDWLVL